MKSFLDLVRSRRSVRQYTQEAVPVEAVAAILEAGRNRFRPILMTSATTILGLLPMALGFGEGAELRGPLAVTVIGGLTVATGLTLLVIPVVYSLLDRKAYAVDVAANRAEFAEPKQADSRLPAVGGAEAAR